MQALIAAITALTTLLTNSITRLQLDGSGNLGGAVPSVALQGTTPLNSTSIALEASRRVKATQGALVGFSGYNSKSTAQFILAFDSNSSTTPANGALPVAILSVAGLANFSFDPGHFGRRFESGIWLANSSTATSLTLGSADVWFDCQYV